MIVSKNGKPLTKRPILIPEDFEDAEDDSIIIRAGLYNMLGQKRLNNSLAFIFAVTIILGCISCYILSIIH